VVAFFPTSTPTPRSYGHAVAAFATLRPRACLPPLWRELGSLVAATVPGSRTATAPAVRAARGPVVLVPGLQGGPGSLSRLHAHLESRGHAVHHAGIERNVECSEIAAERLLARIGEVSERHQAPVTVVGHSRGGLLARVVAQRRPDLVAGVVTLGSPHRDQLAVHPLLWTHILALAALSSFGVPGLLGVGCAIGACCERFRHDLAAPPGVEVVSVHSRRDGLVDWRACIDEHARNVEVRATHLGMTSDRETLTVISAAADRFASTPRTRRRAATAARASRPADSVFVSSTPVGNVGASSTTHQTPTTRLRWATPWRSEVEELLHFG
jgi:pimeloyl-ACP methyl ester carboxylesterase